MAHSEETKNASKTRATQDMELADLTRRMEVDLIHEMAEWRNHKELGNVSGKNIDILLSTLEQTIRQRNSMQVSMRATEILLGERRIEIAKLESEIEKMKPKTLEAEISEWTSEPKKSHKKSK